MMADLKEELLREVSLGIQAETFLGTPVGRYLISRAEDERDEALKEFRTANPEDAVKMRDIQNRVWRAETIQTWLAEVVQAGWNAEELIGRNETTD